MAIKSKIFCFGLFAAISLTGLFLFYNVRLHVPPSSIGEASEGRQALTSKEKQYLGGKLLRYEKKLLNSSLSEEESSILLKEEIIEKEDLTLLQQPDFMLNQRKAKN